MASIPPIFIKAIKPVDNMLLDAGIYNKHSPVGVYYRDGIEVNDKGVFYAYHLLGNPDIMLFLDDGWYELKKKHNAFDELSILDHVTIRLSKILKLL